MNLLEATILGLVEGFTEFLPVSSTGHLLIAERLLGLGGGDTKAGIDAYTVVIQVGAIAAVAVIYWRRLRSFFAGVTGSDPAGRRGLINVLLAFVPAAVIGQVFGDVIKEHLLAPWPVAGAWILGGIAILTISRTLHARTPTWEDFADLTPALALVIGLAQSLALWPGVSRALVTLLCGLAVGLSLKAAVEFSFMLGLVTLGAASCYELLTHAEDITSTVSTGYAVWGIVMAAFSALVSVKFMLRWLETRPLDIFGWYRIAAGAAVAIALLLGVFPHPAI